MNSIFNAINSLLFSKLIFFVIFTAILGLVLPKAGFHVFSGWLLFTSIILFNIYILKEYLIKYPVFGILYVGIFIFQFLFEVISKPACHCIFEDSQLFLFANWFNVKIGYWISKLINGGTMMIASIIIIIGLIAAIKEITTGVPQTYIDFGRSVPGVSFKTMINNLFKLAFTILVFFGVKFQTSFIQCFPCQMICKKIFELDNFIKCFWDNII